MPIPALLAPALISIGVKLAGKAIKSMLKPSDAPAPQASLPQISADSFEKLLKDEQSRGSSQVTLTIAPPVEPSVPSDLIARLGHDQAVRSLTLGLQARLRMPGAPSPAGADPQRFSLAGRLAGKLHLDSFA
jgi:hypothetical protein